MRSVLTGMLFAASVAQAQAVVVDRLAAIVDGRPILRSQVSERMKPLLATAEDKQGLFREVLNQLIDEELIAHDADAMRLDVSPDQVESALADIARSNQLTPDQLVREIEKQGYTMKGYRKTLRGQLVAVRWLMVKSGTRALEDSAQFSKRMDEERGRLVGVLRSRAAIEVLP